MIDYNQLADQELVVLLNKGDQLAFAQIYDRYKFILHAHAINKLRDREEAKDIIQEVFAYLWSRHDVINISGNLSGYLYGSVRHAILNKITRRQVQEKYLDSLKEFSMQDNVLTDHRIREHQLKEQIEKGIRMLPPKMREVFELSRKQYLSHKEIAWKLEISEQTVSKQITNALRLLKLKIGVLAYLALMFLR